MASSYSLQESKGRYTVTVKADLVKLKDWSKGQKLDIKLVGNKLKVTEGSRYTLHYSSSRYFIVVPAAEELGWSKGDDLVWNIDGNGNLELKKP